MYPLPQSSIPTTSGFAPHRPSSTFKPIHPAAPSIASSFNTRIIQHSTWHGSQHTGDKAAPYHVQKNHQQLVNLHQHLYKVCPLSLIVHKYRSHNHNMLHKHTSLSAVACCTPATVTTVTAPSSRLTCCTNAAGSATICAT